MEKCKELALENNVKSQNARLAVEAAEETKKEAFTKYFPSVSATGAGMIFNKPLMTQTVETGYPAPNDKVEVDMFKSGLIGGVMATQPVFAGGQIVNGNRLAKAGVEASRLQMQMTDNETLLATERYFWSLVSLKEKMKTIAEAETMLNRVQSDVKAAVEAGLTMHNDQMRVTLEQNRLASNRLKLENGIRTLKMAFGQHIGVAGSFDIQQPDFADIALPLTTDPRLSLPNRPEYRLLEKSVDVAKLQLRMETGKNLPTVAIGAGYNYVNFDNGKPAEMEKKMGIAFATVSVPISSWWGGSHAIKKKKLELLAAENTRRENAELLLIQMQQLGAELGEAYQQVALAQQSIAVAEENVRLSEDHYRAGVSILSDLLDAQNLLQQSRDQYVEAATEYCLKLAEYRQATGITAGTK
ncbi:MAG: TolC family protein [Tannerellaceae bacterium]|nr:TolC family protein [Tannerellaceae bacterium]